MSRCNDDFSTPQKCEQTTLNVIQKLWRKPNSSAYEKTIIRKLPLDKRPLFTNPWAKTYAKRLLMASPMSLYTQKLNTFSKLRTSYNTSRRIWWKFRSLLFLSFTWWGSMCKLLSPTRPNFTTELYLIPNKKRKSLHRHPWLRFFQNQYTNCPKKTKSNRKENISLTL